MKLRFSRAMLASVLLLLLTFTGVASADVDYIALATDYCARLGQPIGEQPQVRRKDDVVQVWSSNSLVEMKLDGTFLSYADLNPKDQARTDGEEKFPLDAPAWEHLERVVSKFELPEGLERTSLQRTEFGSSPPILKFEMGVKAHGFPVEGGNLVHAQLARWSGRIMFLFIGTGWSFEAPNIQVNRDRAFEIASKAVAEPVGDFKLEMRYTTSPREDAPEAIRELNRQKTMRLCYVASGKRGSVVIDSVTGDVVFSGKVGSVKRIESVIPWSQKEFADLQSSSLKKSHEMGERPSDAPKWPMIVGGLVLAFGALFAIRWAARRVG